MKKFAALSLAAVMLTSAFVGCGSKSSSKDKDYAGKYELQKMSMGDESYEGDVAGTPIALMMQVELKSDGTAVENSLTGDNGTGKWEADGDTVTIEIDGDKVKFEADGDTLTGKQGEGDEAMEMVIKKVSEFTTKASK